MNFARLNHILIPSTLEARERLRKKRFVRLLRPFAWFYSALSEEGRIMSLLVLFVGTAAVEVGRTQVYMLWAVLVGLMFASLALRRLFSLKGVSLDAHSPERISVGSEMAFQLTLRSAHDANHHAIRLRGPFLPWDGGWKGALPRTQKLEAGGAWTTQVRARFIERGPHHIEPFTACALLPFGLAMGPETGSRGIRFTVVPRLAPVTIDGSRQGDSQHHGGARQSLRRGDAMEILGVRPYRRGDPVRDLHPKTWARSGIPHVREYQQETYSRIGIIVDTSDAGGTEEGFEATLSLAAGIIASLAQGEAVVEALVLGDVVTRFAKGSSLGTLNQALDVLAHAKVSDEIPVDALLNKLTPLLATMSSLIVVTQSADPSRLELIAALQRRQLAARLIRVHDDTGLSWLPTRRKLVDARTTDERVVLATRINGEEPIVL